MTIAKENFLRSRLVSCLQRIPPDTAPLWGQMSLHHMVEHMSDVLMVASGKLKMQVLTPPDKLPLYREFMMSDKPFKENTKSPVLPKDLIPLRTNTLSAAIGKLQEEIIGFFQAFEKEPGLRTAHPAFGELDFNENVQVLYKHALHHLKQFGVEPLQV